MFLNIRLGSKHGGPIQPPHPFDRSEDSWLIINNSGPLHNIIQTLDETQVRRILFKVVLSVVLVFELDYETVRKATL